jgi:5-methylcytosine-specific restriction endonuclease McrA
MDSLTCLSEIRRLRSEAGYGVFDACVKKIMRERLQVQGRPERKRYPWGEYKRLYEQQGGLCPLCQEVMPLIRGKVQMDHKNPNLTGEAFEARSNRQVTCSGCNAEKGAMSIAQQAKHYNLTMKDLV